MLQLGLQLYFVGVAAVDAVQPVVAAVTLSFFEDVLLLELAVLRMHH